MQLKFDRHTLTKFIDTGHVHVYVFFVRAGCAGWKVQFKSSNEPYNNLEEFPQDSGIIVYCDLGDMEKLDGSQIAVKDGRNYFVTSQVQSRCGCGTSIDFTKKQINTSMEKIHRIGKELGKLGLLKK